MQIEPSTAEGPPILIEGVPTSAERNIEVAVANDIGRETVQYVSNIYTSATSTSIT